MTAEGAREEVLIEGRTLVLTHLDRVLWPDTGFTKRDLVAYYRAIAPALLPHVRGRALTLARFPEGIYGKGWYQTNTRGNPDWLPIVPLPAKAGPPLRYCVVNDLPSLVWVANLGTIELHPFLGPAAPPPVEERPDLVVFDLDPGPPAGLLACARVALLVRDVLVARGLRPVAKTSGAKGLHVYAGVCGATYGQTKAFARAVARDLAGRVGELVVAAQPRAARAGKVLIDWAQNDPRRSTVAPWSLRATRRPLVSTPVTWAEVEHAVRGGDPRALVFGPDEARARWGRLGDPFVAALEPGAASITLRPPAPPSGSPRPA